MPLQIKDNGVKKSLIFDMSRLNNYVEKSSFKLDSWPEMIDYCADANFAIKFDMKKYYYQIKLDPAEYKYYGFKYQMLDGEPERYFVWKSLPYGYTRAPYIAREIMKPLIAKWRRIGGRIVVFYDDGMSVHKDHDTLMALSVQMQCDLLNAGLIPGIEKCTWQPAVNIDWNGLHFDFREKIVSILGKRIEKTLTLIDLMLNKFPTFTYREVAKLVGTIISMASVFEGVSQLFTRNMQTFVNIRHCEDRNWDAIISAEYTGLYTSMYEELLFWKTNLVKQNSRSFIRKRPEWIGWTDASDYACGGLVVHLKNNNENIPLTADNLILNHNNAYMNLRRGTRALAESYPWSHRKYTVRGPYDLDMANVDESLVCYRSFSPLEVATDSNERELLAISRVVQAVCNKVAGSVFTIHTDNTNAAIICTKGSPKPRLNKHAAKIASIGIKYDFKINVVWVPRTLNNVADYISVLRDYTDYSIKQCYYDIICADFDIYPEVDLFASDYNTKVCKFFSLTYCPGTIGVNSFNYDWSQYGVGWIFVPPPMILRCINHMRIVQSAALVLIPQWKTSCFYPVFTDLETSGVAKRKKVFSGRDMFKLGQDVGSYFGPDYSGYIEVWFIDYRC
jgi:hypothetical protein